MNPEHYKLVFSVTDSGYKAWWFPAMGLLFSNVRDCHTNTPKVAADQFFMGLDVYFQQRSEDFHLQLVWEDNVEEVEPAIGRTRS